MTTTEGLTEDDYSTAVAAAVDLVRTKHPNLDLRAGTAIRSLVIEPGAFIDASQRDVVNRLRTALSLQAMARETTVPREDADAVLSNFGISLGKGAKAAGLVRVNLTGSADITVRAGITFTTESGVVFTATQTVTASADPADGQETLHVAEGGKYYFVVPVEAQEVGASGNIAQGVSLTCSAILGNYYSSEAFADFSGGEDGETVAAAVARIPSALAYRGMTNALSVRAQLSSRLSDPSRLRAVSCVGYRDRAQLRDKHNLLGLAVGGRVDVYARLFDAPGVVSFVVEGELVATLPNPTSGSGNVIGKYRVPLPSYPGFYAVKYVGPSNHPNRQGSLPYDLVRGTVSGATDAHDFVITADSCETAWSAYQNGTLYVYDGVDGESHLLATAAAVTERPLTASFKVDLYWTSGIDELQALVDDPEVRNVAADYVVRSPALCLVSVQASVRMKAGASSTASDLESALADYINGRSFVSRLTRSELANVLLQHGVESVDLSDGGLYLGGRICGADGVWYHLEGDSLDVSSVGPERAMLTSGTVAFAAEQGAIQISVAK